MIASFLPQIIFRLTVATIWESTKPCSCSKLASLKRASYVLRVKICISNGNVGSHPFWPQRHFDPGDTLTPRTLWPQVHFDPGTLWPRGHFDPKDTLTPGTLWPQGHFDPRHFDPTHFDPEVKYHIFGFSIRIKLMVGSELPKSLFKALICTFLSYRDIY